MKIQQAWAIARSVDKPGEKSSGGRVPLGLFFVRETKMGANNGFIFYFFENR